MPQAPPPGWYDDPAGSASLRYWDGGTWTGHLQPPAEADQAAPSAVAVPVYSTPIQAPGAPSSFMTASGQTLDAATHPAGAQHSGPMLATVGRRIAGGLLDMVLYVVTLGIGWIGWAAVTAADGQTPAKRLLGMQVIDERTHQPLTWSRYFFLRGVVGGTIQSFVVPLTLMILAFMPFWDRRNQTIAGKVSSSLVVLAPRQTPDTAGTGRGWRLALPVGLGAGAIVVVLLYYLTGYTLQALMLGAVVAVTGSGVMAYAGR